jgi:hypothetical protein
VSNERKKENLPADSKDWDPLGEVLSLDDESLNIKKNKK